ncbi:MAG: Tn3 family transposase [Oligoflexia bacterium]|nr:Tn3 family transposase [Oligoflexia bacterium]
MAEVSNQGSLFKSKRVCILTTTEMEDLYSRPEFSEDERNCFFELNQEEEKILVANTSIATKVDAIIRLGYFKQKQQFFQFDLQEVKQDVDYLLKKYFSPSTLDKSMVARKTKIKNQQWVLSITGYKLFKQSHHIPVLLKKAEKICRISIDPLFIFRELLTMVTQLKITLPGYSTFQTVISRALLSEQKRIGKLIEKQLSHEERVQLFKLLKKEEDFYAVTLLKHQPKNFKPTAIRQEISYYEQYHPLYQVAERILPLLEISKKGIEYYADLIEHYAVHSLLRANSNQACLWLLCFVFNRCQRMLDNLATMFIYIANKYQDEVRERAEHLLLINSLSSDEQKKALSKLIRVYVDKNVNDNRPFKAIKKLVYTTILPAKDIDRVANELDSQDQQKLHQTQFVWQAVDELANTYRPLLRALIKMLPLEGTQHLPLQKAYDFLHHNLNKEQSLSKLPSDDFPTKFMNDKILTFIYDGDKKIINVDRYEYECYHRMAKHLNDRSLFLNGTINYQSLTAELLPNWEEKKSVILKRLNKPLLNCSLEKFIKERATPLDQKIIAVNEEITSGNNHYVKLKKEKDGSIIWTLPYTKKSVELNNPFYEKLPSISIVRIMEFVNGQTQFMRQFTHFKPYCSKSHLDVTATYACLLANGTNLGIFKMAKLCDLNLSCLQLTEKNYLRLATIRAANDIISNAVAKLPIFRHWNLQPDLLHASLDGQKHSTERDNFFARHSRKHLGQGPCVSSISLIANNLPVNTTAISGADHESRFLFDLAYNNSSDIQPDVFSTDTGGSNKLNFLLLYLIDRAYAPRYRSLRDKCDSIISFSDPKNFKDLIIKPERKLNEKLILSEEDNIKHILASLLAGETKQSTIVSKLSSENFASRTKRALWELNSVLMTNHLLNYVRSLPLRQAIQGALNRGEAYNQLRRHIEKVNGGLFRGTNEKQILMWNECTRLLANCLIYYNATMLNKWMERSDRRGETKKSEFIRGLSPVAWTHVNFQGIYEFLATNEAIDIDNLLDKILIDEADFMRGK